MVSSGEDRNTTGKSPIEDDEASDSDGDAAEDILEESPDKRWSKRREQVKQRDVPGIDVAYLAMDNETGNEVVWNEVQFSERKNFRAQEEKINAVFDNLTQLVHTNLVKFHKYWTDSKSEKPRIIFITEYMSSGSMSAFLQRTRKAGSPLSIKAWKKWTTQILSALNYLHSSDPSIIHGNLTCNTVFIQQNGLIKIGCVAPDAINHHVKTCRENMRYMHYIAPEYENSTEVTSAADIYSFGICSLEIAVVGGLSGCQNGSSEGPVTEDVIEKAIKSLEDPLQQDFIRQCLRKNPSDRPSARELLFHQILFEVHSLKLLSAHAIVDSKRYDDVSESVFRIADNEKIAATSKLREMAYCQVSAFQLDLEKFLDDVRNGIYPLTAFAPLAHQPSTTLRAYSNQNYGAIQTTMCDSTGSRQTGNTSTTSTSRQDGQLNNGTTKNGGVDDTTSSISSTSISNNINGVCSTTTVGGGGGEGGNGGTSQQSGIGGGGSVEAAGSTSSQREKSVGQKSATPEAQNRKDVTGGGASTTTSGDPGNNSHHEGSNGINGGGGSTQTEGGSAGQGGRDAQSPTPSGEETQTQGDVRSENRHCLEINVHIEDDEVSIVLLLEDQMHRQLTTSLSKTDTPQSLTENLVTHGFVCQLDSEGVEQAIAEAFSIRARKMAEGGELEDETNEPMIESTIDEKSSTTSMNNCELSMTTTTTTTNLISTIKTTTTTTSNTQPPPPSSTSSAAALPSTTTS